MYEDDFEPTTIKQIIGVAVILALMGGAIVSLSLNVMIFLGFMGVILMLLLS
jgi:hypothetical protein